MKLMKRCWRWWIDAYDHDGENWFGVTFLAFIVGILVGGLTGHVTRELIGWITFIGITSLPTSIVIVSCLIAGIFDVLVGLWLGSSRWLKTMRTLAICNDKILKGQIDPARFEVEYHPHVTDISGIDIVAAVKEFVSDQRQRSLGQNESITIHGSKVEGEHKTVLFTLSRFSSKTSDGVKKDNLQSVTVEVRFHFVPVTRSLHIDGAGSVLQDQLAGAESSLDVINSLRELRLGTADPVSLFRQELATANINEAITQRKSNPTTN